MNKLLVAGFLLLSSCTSSIAAEEQVPEEPSSPEQAPRGPVCAPRKQAFETMKEKHFIPFAGGVNTSGRIITFWVDREGQWVVTMSDPKTTCVADMGKGFEVVSPPKGESVDE